MLHIKCFSNSRTSDFFWGGVLRGDEHNWAITHIYMEVAQKNSLCSSLKQAKCHFYFFYKIREQECSTGPAWEGVVPVGRGRRWEKV
jgi:hypothetical protein